MRTSTHNQTSLAETGGGQGIPFNVPCLSGRELEYVRAAAASGQIHGDGPFTMRCHAMLERRYACCKALLTHSGTAALEMAALLCDLAPGDEVILPSFTFSSTATAFLLRGAKLVWCDIRPDTQNIDERLIESLITPRTRAIVPVHYGGVACEMDAIMEIAHRHDLFVIEDAAQAIEASYKGCLLGGIGDFGCFSFHNTKNVVAGEGGAILINDEALARRAEILREKGTNRSAFLRGETDKYTWVDTGSSYLPSELTAAFLQAQLEDAEAITHRRLAAWNLYHQRLAPLGKAGLLQVPHIPDHCCHNAHIFYLILPTESLRDGLLDHLNARGIRAIFHYVPLHSSPQGRRLAGGSVPHLPVTDATAAGLLRLPLYAELSADAIDRICREVTAFLRRTH